MRTVSQILFSNKVELNTKKEVARDPMPGTVKQTRTSEEENLRVTRDELEFSYFKNPVIFNSVNKTVQSIMSSPNKLVSKDQNTITFYSEFLDSLGTRGGTSSWEELKEQIFNDQCVYGCAFVEKIPSKLSGKTIDWDTIDPKTLDYAKDHNGNIVFDEDGNPVGYLQTIETPINIPEDVQNMSDESVPDGVNILAGQIFIPYNKIVQFKMYKVGDGFYPIGLVEPVYKTSIRKMNLEDSFANTLYSFPMLVASLGDDQHEPTPNQVSSMQEKLKSKNIGSKVTFPYYHQFKIIEPSSIKGITDNLIYFRDSEVSGLGIPETYATGLGEDTNKSVLDNQSELFLLTLKHLIKKTCETIENKLFKPLSKEYSVGVPKLDWDMVGIGHSDMKAKRLVSYVKEGLISPEHPIVLELIKSIERLDDDFDLSPHKTGVKSEGVTKDE